MHEDLSLCFLASAYCLGPDLVRISSKFALDILTFSQASDIQLSGE